MYKFSWVTGMGPSITTTNRCPGRSPLLAARLSLLSSFSCILYLRATLVRVSPLRTVCFTLRRVRQG